MFFFSDFFFPFYFLPWARLLFRNDKMCISKETAFYRIVRSEGATRKLLRRLLNPQYFICKEQQLSGFKLNFH